jgi:hypothetical protein
MSLLDDVKDLPPKVWTSSIMEKHQGKRVQSLAPKARQFIFDEQASEYLGRFISECPDILIDQMEFARQPFDVTYIELDLAACYRGTGKPTTMDYYPEPDWKIGFLSHGGIVNGFTNSRQRPTPYLSPLCILDEEYHPEAKVDALIDDSRVLLGTTWYDLNDAQRAAVAQRFAMGYIGPPEHRESVLKHMIPASMGEARVYLAALLLLFNKHRVIVCDEPFQRRINKGKLRTYMAHSTISIHLTNYLDLKRDLERTQHERSVRRHEVRAHYKHRYLTPGCEHQWTRVEDAQNEQWRCTCCSGLRYLCKDHLRGDGGIGFVTKDYIVSL